MLDGKVIELLHEAMREVIPIALELRDTVPLYRLHRRQGGRAASLRNWSDISIGFNSKQNCSRRDRLGAAELHPELSTAQHIFLTPTTLTLMA